MRFYNILFIFCIFSLTEGNNDTEEVDINVTSLANEIITWVRTGKETETFKEAIQYLALPSELQIADWRSFTGLRSLGICTICQSTLSAFIMLRRQGMSQNDIEKSIIKICVLLNFQTERVCTGVVKLNAPIILHIVDSKPNLNANTICGVVLESKSCPLKAKEYEWTISLDNIPDRTITRKEESNDAIKIVQITDIHYDPKYEPYGNPECGEPTCCRKGQNDTNSSKLAGFWGDYNNCDTPWHSVVDALSHINTTHQNIDYVYFTGDIIDHGVWETSREANMESLYKSYNEIYEAFKGIPVYPILGNHEPHPLNQFAPQSITDDNLSTQWLYNMVADLWINFGWLPESTRATILQGGFYTLTPRKGFRIIVLNNNVCYCYNWWLLYQPQDPDRQLHWLVETLSEAEENEELVHILGHIPPGDNSCQRTWKREYLKIINRFSHIIVAQFNGHTHNDELQIIYRDEDAKNVSNVAWNGGSITTYANLNPNYKVYTIDKNTLEVKDFENWMYNISLANENSNQRPQWYRSYSFKNEYNLTDLSLNSLSDWLVELGSDENVLNRYYENFFKHADPALQIDYDFEYKKEYIKRIIVTPH